MARAPSPCGSGETIRSSATDSPANSASRPGPTTCFSTRPPPSPHGWSAGPCAAVTCAPSGPARESGCYGLMDRTVHRWTISHPTPPRTSPRTRRSSGRARTSRAARPGPCSGRARRPRATGSSGRTSHGASPPAPSLAGATATAFLSTAATWPQWRRPSRRNVWPRGSTRAGLVRSHRSAPCPPPAASIASPRRS